MGSTREEQRRYYAENRERLRLAGRERASRRTPEYRRAIRLRWEQKLESEARSHYGEECVRCGSSESLESDHINDDGKAHREEVGGHKWPVLTDLRKRGWPPALQTLCHDCHIGKEPHHL